MLVLVYVQYFNGLTELLSGSIVHRFGLVESHSSDDYAIESHLAFQGPLGLLPVLLLAPLQHGPGGPLALGPNVALLILLL